MRTEALLAGTTTCSILQSQAPGCNLQIDYSCRDLNQASVLVCPTSRDQPGLQQTHRLRISPPSFLFHA